MMNKRYGECLNCSKEICEGCPIFEKDMLLYPTGDNASPIDDNHIKTVSEIAEATSREMEKKNTGKIKSDGGSSSYYDFIIPRLGKIKTEEVIKYMVDNDFDLGTILKTLRRVSELRAGRGKEGNDILYELNKIKYTADKLIMEYTR